MKTKLSLVALAAISLVAFGAGGASAHTESDVVAVPAGSSATIKLKPTHGCAGSPTVEVAIQAPLTGAVAGEVEGWTATSTPDGDGNTVLEWTGGSLPADQTGEFPVTFDVPDTVGALLTFPSIQTCEDGSELAWISGDPAADYPAPRVLILPAESVPAASIDDVPADAPGREQLAEVVDVDNPQETTTTSPETPTTVADDPEPTATSSPDAADTTVPAPSEDGEDDGDDGSMVVPIVIGVVVLAAVGGGIWLARKKTSSAELD